MTGARTFDITSFLRRNGGEMMQVSEAFFEMVRSNEEAVQVLDEIIDGYDTVVSECQILLPKIMLEIYGVSSKGYVEFDNPMGTQRMKYDDFHELLKTRFQSKFGKDSFISEKLSQALNTIKKWKLV